MLHRKYGDSTNALEEEGIRLGRNRMKRNSTSGVELLPITVTTPSPPESATSARVYIGSPKRYSTECVLGPPSFNDEEESQLEKTPDDVETQLTLPPLPVLPSSKSAPATGIEKTPKESKKKLEKKMRKLENMEKELKRKREESSCKKSEAEEEITHVLVLLRKIIIEIQHMMLIMDHLAEGERGKQHAVMLKKLVSKGALMIKTVKTFRSINSTNNSQLKKTKREFIDIEKEFSDSLNKFYFELITNEVQSDDGSPDHSPPSSPIESPRNKTDDSQTRIRSRAATTIKPMASVTSLSTPPAPKFLTPRRDTLPASLPKKTERDVRKLNQKKTENLAKLGELHLLLTSAIDTLIVNAPPPNALEKSPSFHAIPQSSSTETNPEEAPPSDDDKKMSNAAKRSSVGRTFGRMISKKPEAAKPKDLRSSAGPSANPPAVVKPNNNVIETKNPLMQEALKKKKTQDNYVMALFLAQRPAKETLIARNIIPQSVFGVSVEKLVLGEQRVPSFISHILEYLEATGLEGALFDDDETLVPNIQALQESHDQGRCTSFFDSSPRVCAGLFKRWFSLLPEPIFPPIIRDHLIALNNLEDVDNFVLHFTKSLIFKIPPIHRWILKDVLEFLNCVVKSTSNRYNYESISAIFGPLLLRPIPETTENAIKMFSYLLKNYQFLYEENDCGAAYVMKRGKLCMKSGSTEVIISKLIDPNYEDNNLMSIVLNTYEYYFGTSIQFLELLQNEYSKRLPSRHACREPNPFLPKIRVKILQVLAAWMSISVKEYLTNTQFQEAFVSFCSGASLVATSTEKDLLNVLKAFFNTAKEPPKSLSGSMLHSVPPPLDILQTDTSTLAIAITMIDKRMFESIPITEFLKKNFTKPTNSPFYTEMAKRFNQWSQWVATEVVARQNIQQRVEVLQKFINIAKACLSIYNFNTAYAIVAGLDQSSVSRLKLTWEKLSKQSMATFEELKELFNIQLNHKNYRDALEAATPPLVPYLGLYGKFLLAIEDGNPSKIGDRVNLVKFKKITKQIQEIRRYQEKEYLMEQLIPSTSNFVHDLKIVEKQLYNLTIQAEEETFKLSLICEPRLKPTPGSSKNLKQALPPKRK